MLSALGVQHSKANLQRVASKASEIKGYKRSADKRQNKEEPVVIRRSLRAQGLSPDGKDLEILVKSVSPPRREIKEKTRAPGSRKGFNRAEQRLVNHPPIGMSWEQPYSLESVYLPLQEGASAGCFLERLQSLADEMPLSDLSGLKGSSKRMRPSEVQPSNLTLRSQDVARVVPNRIFSVEFLPVRDRLVLLAGDKFGYLGLWDVDCESLEGDGVHIYRPHDSPISGISIAPFHATRFVTCSYDGVVRQFDVDNAQFDVLYSTDDLLSAISFIPGNAHCAFVAQADGDLTMLDTRDGKNNSGYSLHERRINTIDFNAHATSVMATSSTDATACVWDIRKLKNASSSLVKVEHARAVHSAYFSPSGNLLATCSLDNQIGVLGTFQKDGAAAFGCNHQRRSMIGHYNMTNRWISTFRAIWGWDDEHLYVGNMSRAIDVISTTLNATCCNLSSPFMTSIPCRFAAHPLLPGTLAGSTAGGSLYVWRS